MPVVNPGIRRLLASAIQRLFNGASFSAPLTHSLVPERGTGSPTFTRATTGTFSDNEGVLRTAPAGCARFVGARFVRNLFSATENLNNAYWNKNAITVAADTSVIAGITCQKIEETAVIGAHYVYNSAATFDGTTGVISAHVAKDERDICWLYLVSGTDAVAYFNLTTGTVGTVTGTASPVAEIEEVVGGYRISLKATITPGTINGGVGSTTTDGNLNVQGVLGYGIYVGGLQLEDITGRADQTTPSEYVSVGVVQRNKLLQSNAPNISPWVAVGAPVSFAQDLPAPSGVDCGAGWTHTDGGANIAYAYQASAIPVAADYKYSAFIKKTTGAQASYPVMFGLSAASKAFVVTVDTTNGEATVWTAYTGLTIVTTSASVTDHDSVYWRVTVTFAATAETWAQFAVIPAGTNNLAQTTGTMNAALTGTAGVAGQMLALASADQTYQNVGGSYIYHGAGADGCQFFDTDLDGNPIPAATNLGYLAEGARTNTCLQSNAFTTAPWVELSFPGATQNATGPNGQANYAWTLTDSDATYEGLQQNNVAWAAGASGCYSILVGKKASSPSYPLLLMYYNRASNLYHYIIVNEVAGTVAIGGSTNPPAYGCVSYNDDFWLVWVTGTQAGATVLASLDLYPASSTDGTTLSAAATGSTVFADAQFESGATFPSSRIPTTTAAVTRNADVLTYTGGDIPNLKTLMAGFRREVGVSSVGVHASLYSDATHYTETYLATATEARFIGQDGVVQWNTAASNAYVPGTTSMMAQTWSSNDIKMAKDGIAQTPDTTAAIPTITSLGVGHVADVFQLSGNVGPIYGWTRNQSQSELNAVTQ